MKLDLEDKVIDLKLNGEEFKVDLPRYKVLKDHFKKVQKMESDSSEALDLNMKLLIDCGLPKEKTENLQMHQIEAILNVMAGETSKKK